MQGEAYVTAKLNVLIVDDCDDDADLMALALEDAGMDATCRRVETADELCEALHTPPDWDIVLCDWMLPGFDVLRALSLVRDAQPRVPVLVLSGYAEANLASMLRRDGVSDVLNKNRLVDLAALVRGVLNTRHLRAA